MRSIERLSLVATLLALACGAPTKGGAEASAAKADGKPIETSVDPSTAKKLADGTRALANVAADQRSLIAGAALAEAEVGRLPPELIAALAELPSAAPESRGLLAMKAIATPAGRAPLEALCDRKGAATMAKVAEVTPDQRLTVIWEGCGLERAGLITRAEAQTAGFGQLMLGHIAHRVLLDKGGPTGDELALLRAFVIGSNAG